MIYTEVFVKKKKKIERREARGQGCGERNRERQNGKDYIDWA